MKIVIVGATSAIAEHCCRLWVMEQPTDLTMIVRDLAKAEKIAADLRVRGSGTTVNVVKGDFLDRPPSRHWSIRSPRPGPSTRC